MAHPTVNPQRTVIHGSSIADGTLHGSAMNAAFLTAKLASAVGIGPKIGTAAVGITAAATALQRKLVVVPIGNTNAKAAYATVFRAPPSGATITGLYFCPGSIQNHAVNEADTWKLPFKKWPVGTYMSLNRPSLSNQTLSATAFKQIALSNGACTLLSGQSLYISAYASGSPDALQAPVVVIEWVPKNNA